MSALGEFFSTLVGLGLIDHDPAAGLIPPRIRDRRVLHVRDVHRLLARADLRAALGLRDAAVLHLLTTTGLRERELLVLNVEHLVHETGDLAVVGRPGHRGRLLPLTRPTRQTLTSYLDHGRLLLARVAEERPSRALLLTTLGRRLRRGHLARLLGRLGAEAGLTMPLTPAVLRRTLAAELHRGGLGLDGVRLILGHRGLATTAGILRSVARS